MHSGCFGLLLCLFVCVFVIYDILKMFSLWVFVCINLFIYINFHVQLLFCMAQPLSVISFCYFWVAVLSFFHNYFLLMTLHFCIKSTIKIAVVIDVVLSGGLSLKCLLVHFLCAVVFWVSLPCSHSSLFPSPQTVAELK